MSEHSSNFSGFDADALWSRRKRIHGDKLTEADKRELDDEVQMLWAAVKRVYGKVGTPDFDFEYANVAQRAMQIFEKARTEQKKIKKEFLGWINDLLTAMRGLHDGKQNNLYTTAEFKKEMDEIHSLIS